MSGETNLNTLLALLSPKLLEPDYVFCHSPKGDYGDYKTLTPIASFMEAEGLTLIVERDKADRANLKYQGIFRCITLAVHSSLDAVGLTAAVAGALAEAGISANVIAAFYHDHIFVPAPSCESAMATLETLRARHTT